MSGRRALRLVDCGLPCVKSGRLLQLFFGARPAFTHVMACTLAESPCDPLHRKLRQHRCLCRRFDCYRVERTSSRAGVAPSEVQRLSRRTITQTTLPKAHEGIYTWSSLFTQSSYKPTSWELRLFFDDHSTLADFSVPIRATSSSPYLAGGSQLSGDQSGSHALCLGFAFERELGCNNFLS
jgi:hypothetical protein